MLVNILTCVISFFIGGFIGKKLAAKGITIDANLEKHQGKIIFGLIAIASIILSIYFLSLFNLVYRLFFFIPTIIILYLGSIPYQLVVPSGCLVLGLLIFLELSGKSSQKRKLQLFFAVVILTVPLTIFFNYSLPIANSLEESIITSDGAVRQTTFYTCAPASIATLARRFTKKYANITEKEVAKLTMTNRFGTTVLAEIKAMEKLGLNPKYKHSLSVQDLIKIDRPAILHVRIGPPGKQIGHAVALLSIDPQEKVLIIADPLSGINEIQFDRLKGYWIGEAVFVMA